MIYLAITLATLDAGDARFLAGMAAVIALSIAAVVALVLFSDGRALNGQPDGLEDWRRQRRVGGDPSKSWPRP